MFVLMAQARAGEERHVGVRECYCTVPGQVEGTAERPSVGIIPVRQSCFR